MCIYYKMQSVHIVIETDFSHYIMLLYFSIIFQRLNCLCERISWRWPSAACGYSFRNSNYDSVSTAGTCSNVALLLVDFCLLF